MGRNAEILDAMRTGLVLCDRSERVRIWVGGADRLRFLHNLTTNDVQVLREGEGCEAFVTSPQGRTLGFVTIHVCAEGAWVRSDPGTGARLLAHFQKYGALDDVNVEDASERTFELHVAGAGTMALPNGLGDWSGEEPRIERPAHRIIDVAGHSVVCMREAPLGFPGITLLAESAACPAVLSRVEPPARDDSRPVCRLEDSEWEALRIEAGTPVFGRDITETNLPQEIDRNTRAISFRKGCYLGQETVARLDALGHVNKILRRLRAAHELLLEPGAELRAEGKPVGTVTSWSRSLRTGLPVGLGMVRVAHAGAGTRLMACAETATGEVEVLPGAGDT